MTPSVLKIPASLPGELWGITTFYNPAAYRNKLSNLHRFAERVRAQGLKLLIVELAFGDARFEVATDVGDERYQLRTESILWQKERLLNIGLRRLPPACDKVAWLDADILFENDAWVIEAGRLLESYVVVQPFETACWLPEGLTSSPREVTGHGNKEGECLPGMGYAMSVAENRFLNRRSRRRRTPSRIRVYELMRNSGNPRRSSRWRTSGRPAQFAGGVQESTTPRF